MPVLKPAMLKGATDPAKLQVAMKADLKDRAGDKDVRFIAAKDFVVAKKKINLFIATNSPAAFESMLETVGHTGPRSKGTCDVVKGTGATVAVTIKTAVGQLSPKLVANLVRVAVGNDSNFTATAAAEPKTTEAPVKSGAPEWAKRAYKFEAKRTLITSMTKDGKIGSVYFDDGSRIRTTHGSGPSQEKHEGQKTMQFNLRDDIAQAIYEKNVKPIKTQKDFDEYDRWLALQLKGLTYKTLPNWITLVAKPEEAHDLSEGNPTGALTLFEIFKGINGRVEGWHPSRGTATKFVTDKQTISVLQAAIKHIDGLKLTDPGDRNIAFYEFVEKRLPKFVQYMRKPNEV